MVSTATIEKRWQIEGVYDNGKRFAFPVSAYSHTDAKAKAAKRTSGKITSVRLVESKKEKEAQRRKAIKAARGWL